MIMLYTDLKKENCVCALLSIIMKKISYLK